MANRAVPEPIVSTDDEQSCDAGTQSSSQNTQKDFLEPDKDHRSTHGSMHLGSALNFLFRRMPFVSRSQPQPTQVVSQLSNDFLDPISTENDTNIPTNSMDGKLSEDKDPIFPGAESSVASDPSCLPQTSTCPLSELPTSIRNTQREQHSEQSEWKVQMGTALESQAEANYSPPLEILPSMESVSARQEVVEKWKPEQSALNDILSKDTEQYTQPHNIPLSRNAPVSESKSENGSRVESLGLEYPLTEKLSLVKPDRYSASDMLSSLPNPPQVETASTKFSVFDAAHSGRSIAFEQLSTDSESVLHSHNREVSQTTQPVKDDSLAVGSPIACGEHPNNRRENGSHHGPPDILPDPVSFSAQICAAARASEAALPDHLRLFDDPLAAHLAGPLAMRRRAQLVSGFKDPLVPRERIPIRTKYFDDFLVRSLQSAAGHNASPRQVVLLGAGMDTRPYRIPQLAVDCSTSESSSHVIVYEVDQSCVMNLKDKLLRQMERPPVPYCMVHRVSTDISRLGWESALVEAGFDWRSPSIWIIEGLVYYFLPEVVDSIFRTIGYLACEGSRLCFSNVTEINGSDSQSESVSSAMPDSLVSEEDALQVKLRFKFACPDPSVLLRKTGFQLEKISFLGGPDANFGRWPADKEPSKATMYVTCRPASITK